jgi:transposase
LTPSSPRQRQYEALRCYYVEERPVKEVAQQFGYTPGAFHALCHQFRRDNERRFFVETKPGPKYAPKRDQARALVVKLRKKNYSVEDIQYALRESAHIELSTVSIWTILNEEGFTKLVRRRDEERPQRPRPERAAYADRRVFSLAPRTLETKVGGVFLLLRLLAEMKLHTLPEALGWYGSKMIPIANAFFACLVLKLIGKTRKSHVMDLAFDEGLALALGLNEVPKKSYITEYSERITHRDNLVFLHRWMKKLHQVELIGGESFNLDFQSLPYAGDDEVVEEHYVSMRSRRQKAVLVFFAQDSQSRLFCYSNADLRKGEEASEIFRFIEFWRKQTGKNPPHLVFDSKLTTQKNLSELNRRKIKFVTLRARKPGLLKAIANAPRSAWRRIELRNVARKYRTPKVIDQRVTLTGYRGLIRQLWVKDLGHDLPTIIITNDETTSGSELISRYALRMLIENAIADASGFFHNTALSCTVAMRIDFDVLLTLVAQPAYYMLAQQLRGYEHCGPEVIFRKFIDTPATIFIGEQEIEVRLNKRANNPLLRDSPLLYTPFTLPWVSNRKFIITHK